MVPHNTLSANILFAQKLHSSLSAPLPGPCLLLVIAMGLRISLLILALLKI